MAARGARKGVLDLTPHVDKKVRVRFEGGREVVGTLKGFDLMVNLVLQDCVEYMTKGAESGDPYENNGKERRLGLIVARGTNVMMVAPEEGYEAIDNPFLDAGDDEDGEEAVAAS